MTNKNIHQLPSSFRDPSGFLFTREGILYRQVNKEYQANYDKLMESGLYQSLVKKKWLVSHEENARIQPVDSSIFYKLIKPEIVEYISYPYELSFSQLKDAALLTLKIQKFALEQGMILKDASAYNIQFHQGKPILIDTLSFEIYQEGKPWDAYQQFCRHFLAPLALMSGVDIRLNQLMRVYIDGIPLDLASKLLPMKSRLNFGLMTHIHMHANVQQKYSGSQTDRKEPAKIAKNGLLGLIDSLENTIKGLAWQPKGTEWAEYYVITNYSSESFEKKKLLVKEFIAKTGGKMIWDLGANTGEFSRSALPNNGLVVAFDIDPAAVEKNYLEVKRNRETGILPLVLDLTNPSGDIGWAGCERESFARRGPVDVTLALALIHHICISNNVPLNNFADFLHSFSNFLIIEFVPKTDSQVQILLSTRKDIFPEYHIEGFEQAFLLYFDLCEKSPVEGSERVLYLFKRKSPL